MRYYVNKKEKGKTGPFNPINSSEKNPITPMTRAMIVLSFNFHEMVNNGMCDG